MHERAKGLTGVYVTTKDGPDDGKLGIKVACETADNQRLSERPRAA